MTMLPEKRKCPNCGRMYSWNPDVGKFRCPYCNGSGPEMPGKPVKLSHGADGAADWFKDRKTGADK